MVKRVVYELNGRLVKVHKHWRPGEAEKMASFIRRFKPDAKSVRVVSTGKDYYVPKTKVIKPLTPRRMAILKVVNRESPWGFTHADYWTMTALFKAVNPNITYRQFKRDVDFLEENRFIKSKKIIRRRGGFRRIIIRKG